MSHFFSLSDAVRSLETDPSTANQPIKRIFLCDGEFLTVNIGVITDSGNALHTQRHHDEVVVVLQGSVDFRVGDETRRVQPGDLIFIPRNTLHGPILTDGQEFAGLSIYAPYFNRSKQNIDWERDRAA